MDENNRSHEAAHPTSATSQTQPGSAEPGSLEERLARIERLTAELDELAGAPNEPVKVHPENAATRQAHTPVEEPDTVDAASAPPKPAAPPTSMRDTQRLPSLAELGSPRSPRHPARSERRVGHRNGAGSSPGGSPSPSRGNSHPGSPRPAVGNSGDVAGGNTSNTGNIRNTGRRRRWMLGIFVAALAIPAFAIGAIQPWLSPNKPSDQLSIAGGMHPAESRANGVLPGSAAPNDPETLVPSTATSDKNEPPASPHRAGEGSGSGSPTPSQPGTVPQRGPVDPLQVTVQADNVQPQVGESVTFTVEWSDGSGMLSGLTEQWGDDTPQGGGTDSGDCQGDAPATKGTREVSHAFKKVGTFVVHIAVTTYTCDGQTETKWVDLTVSVDPKPTSPPESGGTPTPSSNGAKPSDLSPSQS